jgi:folate-binding protein YgfZ
MPVPHQKSMQRPNFSQSPKRVGSGPGGAPLGSGGRGIMAGVGAGAPDPASFALISADARAAAVETGMSASVPELRITDHRATVGKTTHAMKQLGAVCLLDDYGTLRFSGADVEKFLQGQLSNDVSALAPGALLRAGLHNPQGRTLALLWLLALDQAEMLAIVPLELLSTVATHLRRYVLRAKVTISDETAQYRVCGVSAPDAAAAMAGRQVSFGSPDGRRLLLQSALEPRPSAPVMSREQWRGLDIAAGLAQVYAATSGLFVAQMLNLDCIDAISFTKGCYTGQEVIARAHYRGRIKRRMQRFLSRSAPRLTAGDAGRLADGRSFRVVEATQRADGGCEFLAVASLPGAAEQADDSGQRPASEGVDFTALPLPYRLPE